MDTPLFDELTDSEKLEAINRHLVKDLSVLPDSAQKKIAEHNEEYAAEVSAHETLKTG